VLSGGKSVRESKWVDWNRYTDELSFAQAFRQVVVNQGFASGVGMLIDTSRNGWGGTARPTGPGVQLIAPAGATPSAAHTSRNNAYQRTAPRADE